MPVFLVGLILMAGGGFLLWRVRFWRHQGRQLQVPGFLPPAPSAFGRAFLRAASHLGVFLFVGPVRVFHTAREQPLRPTMIIVNHQFPLDFMVVATALRTAFRHLGKAAEMRGLRGTAAAFAGFFSAQVEFGRAEGESGAAVIDAGARIIQQDHNCPLLWFAQGRLVYDNILSDADFRTGAIRTLQRATELGFADPGNITILPVYIGYRREPRHATRGWRLAQRMGLRFFRRFTHLRRADGREWQETVTNHGASVVVGRSIRLEELPGDPRQAIESIRRELLALATIVERSNEGGAAALRPA